MGYGNASSLRRKKRLLKVKELCEERDYTNQEVADIVGISIRLVSDYKKELGLTKEQGFTKICQFAGCGRPHSAKGWCNTHWAQMSRHGKVHPIVTDETAEDRFWRQVDKKDNDQCWEWIGPETGKFAKSITTQGYGQLYFKGRKWMAHRFSYEIYNKVELEEHITLDHLCRNKMCVNPKHLEPVTRQENIKRMHGYHSMAHEIRRLRQLVTDLGGDPGFFEMP